MKKNLTKTLVIFLVLIFCFGTFVTLCSAKTGIPTFMICTNGADEEHYGHLIATYPDGSTEDLGKVKGEIGERGMRGVRGETGKDGNTYLVAVIVCAAVCVVCVIILIFYVLKKRKELLEETMARRAKEKEAALAASEEAAADEEVFAEEEGAAEEQGAEDADANADADAAEEKEPAPYAPAWNRFSVDQAKAAVEREAAVAAAPEEPQASVPEIADVAKKFTFSYNPPSHKFGADEDPFRKVIWICRYCGQKNDTRSCAGCGKQRPIDVVPVEEETAGLTCECGYTADEPYAFCPKCGRPGSNK